MALQQILARAVGDDIIKNESTVVDFEDHGDKVMMWYCLLKIRLKLCFLVHLLKECVA